MKREEIKPKPDIDFGMGSMQEGMGESQFFNQGFPNPMMFE